MTTAYFSTMLDAPIEDVWTTVRDFGAYEWAGNQYSAVIEDGRAGDAVGAIRRIGDDGAMRQRLVQLSDADHSFTYDIVLGSPIEVDNYRATVRLRPIIDTGKTFVEWSATFDCAPEDAEHWRHFYAGERFPAWLHALRSRITA
jgi:Polyketide cyclase / dehydrase and lipid transport